MVKPILVVNGVQATRPKQRHDPEFCITPQYSAVCSCAADSAIRGCNGCPPKPVLPKRELCVR